MSIYQGRVGKGFLFLFCLYGLFFFGHTRAQDLDYYCNTQIEYELRGIPVKLDVLWRYQAAPGTGDTHLAIFLGANASVEILSFAIIGRRDKIVLMAKKRRQFVGQKFESFDDDGVRTLLEHILSAASHEIDEAASVQEAVV